MGSKSCYPVKTLSNQINKVRYYSSLTNNIKRELKMNMNPWFLTGFSDSEACFIINLYRSSKHVEGWDAGASIEIGLHPKYFSILSRMKSYLGVGIFIARLNSSSIYSVNYLEDIAVIIDHFENYPLITQKKPITFYLNMLFLWSIINNI